MSYYEIRPLVLAQLAQVALQAMHHRGQSNPDPDAILRGALDLETAMFRVGKEFPDRNDYPWGDRSGQRPAPTPPHEPYSYPDNPPPGLTPAPR